MSKRSLRHRIAPLIMGVSLLAMVTLYTTRAEHAQQFAASATRDRAQTPSATGNSQSNAQADAPAKGDDISPAVSDGERSAPAIAAYDLSLQIDSASAHLTSLARLTIRNEGAAPLQRVALQISSTLHWDGASTDPASGSVKLPFLQHALATDADHTGAANEVVIQLPQPLAPGARVGLTLFYSGEIARSTVRLERSGAPSDLSARVEWDRIEESGTYLRGFGNVLWYPVAAPPVLLDDGAALTTEAGRQKLRQQHATVRLRVSSTYTGAPPGAVFFCGRRGSLTLTGEENADPGTAKAGVATAEFGPGPLGFRPISLFLVGGAPEPDGELLAVIGGSKREMDALRGSAEEVAPLLSQWLGVKPETQLTLLTQDSESFADGAFVVAPSRALENTAAMTDALTHAWFHSAQPWLDRGVPELMAVLWLERSQGRPAAAAQMDEESRVLALTESNVTVTSAANGGLLEASDDVLLRDKSTAVLWMLRGLVGDEKLQQALQRVRLDAALDRDPHGFEQALEQTAGKPFGWFFADWVDHDRGLPDLVITGVTPRIVAGRPGQRDGALVAVEVQNNGGAVADVPVTVRSGELTATERLRVPAHANASVRILFQGTPEQVEVNDGSVPELASSTHLRRIAAQP